MRTILLIDDDQIFNFISSEMIHETDPDIRIITYLSSAEALIWLKGLLDRHEPLPDILFLDIRMPEITGFELLEKLLQDYPQEDLKRMRTYMLTSSLDENDNVRASKNPLVQGFLGKPLDIVELVKILS
ncbi:MAG: response regulator [Bacteroidia bacterium]|jgi:CheY-like chemotaxis protein